jgi:beta-ribofuranosylaminobenzene 5'-phosphate synthase
MKKIKIKTPSRIHITLIDLNGEIGRVDGGLGLTLTEPYVEVEGVLSDSVNLAGNSLNSERFLKTAKKLSDAFGRGIELNVNKDYRSHVGLGSGTQISLAVAEIYKRLYNLDLSLTELAGLVGRGGTSGIGVAAFRLGGFIVDGGHSKKIKKDFLPSSASKAPPPPVIARYDFPDWDIVVAIPDLTGYFGDREVDLFQKYCPISISEVRALSHIILMKVMPSIVEGDLDDFSDAIARIQTLGFKRVEIDQYGELIREVINSVRENKVAVGMSSTGPTIYAVTDSGSNEVARDIKSAFKESDIGCETIITKANNNGAKIKEIEL